MSDWSEVCDALFKDLTANVRQLADAIPHLYAPRDPERFLAAPDERHLAVWPDPNGETAIGLTTAAHELVQNYVIAYWEWAGDEDERQVLDPELEKPVLDIANAIRDRLYVLTNQVLGVTTNRESPTYKVWYTGTLFPDRTGRTRWVAVGVEAHRTKEFA